LASGAWGFFGRVRRRPMAATALFLRNEFSKSSMGTLIFLTLELWAGHFAADGYGCRKLMLIALGLVYFSSSTKLLGLV